MLLLLVLVTEFVGEGRGVTVSSTFVELCFAEAPVANHPQVR